MAWELINRILFFVMSGFFIFGLVGTMNNIEDKQAVFDHFMNDTANATVGVAQFLYGYNGVTPSLTNDWLPPTGKHIFILEDLPLPDPTDFIILIPILGITAWILRKIKYFQHGWGVFWMIIIIILVALIAWLILKLILYNMMLTGADKLGVPREEILQGRLAASEEAAVLPVVWLTITFAVLTLAKTITGLFKEKEKKGKRS